MDVQIDIDSATVDAIEIKPIAEPGVERSERRPGHTAGSHQRGSGAGAVALSRVLANLLFDTIPTDPSTFAIVSLVLLVAALTACFLPARRTMRVDPMVALRTE